MKTKPVSFKTTKEESTIISDIVKRAQALLNVDPLDTAMDISATHANGNPLRLQELLDADDFNFTHDVLGIASNIDCNTGKLRNHFLPRFSK